MAENIFKTEYDVTRKSKIKKFYEENRILIYAFVFIIFGTFASFSFYFESKEKKRVLLSDNYINAKIYLERGDKVKSKNLLIEIIHANDSTYSPLSLFLLINQKLITDQNELKKMFEHVLKNNNFSEEIESLLTYKKVLYISDSLDEIEMLESLNTLINSENLWKPHALLLMGDYYVSKGELVKAIEFYQKIFTIKNLHQSIYNHAKYQLSIISND